jgi:trehalose 6-phosphate synthase
MTGPGTEQKPPVVAVASRLPVVRGDDGWQISPGGLVTALRPVMATHAGAWVGWDGGAKGMPRSLPDVNLSLRPVSIPPSQSRQYYHGFANSTLWPLLHDAIEKPRFDRGWWQSYRSVNEAFAAAAATALTEWPGALAWVHDYHLMLVPSLIRERQPRQPIGFFLHVPWPSPEIFARLPWREDMLLGLLGADVVSFHTDRFRENFLQSCDRLLADTDVKVSGSTITLTDGRVVATTTAPISIDAGELSSLATSGAVNDEVASLRQQFAGRTLLLGVDRLDYTKGIIERLLAIEMLLQRREDLRSKLAFLQVAVPSRDDVPQYRSLRAEVERQVGRVNGQFTEPGAEVPVHYLYRGLQPEQLAAYYAMADTMLVTPLIDGMNLVAKEFVTVQDARGGSGCLILSEFTGAAAELREAVPCNPFDVEGLSYRIERALELPAGARRTAVAAMANRVHAHDVHRWVANQLSEIASHRL